MRRGLEKGKYKFKMHILFLWMSRIIFQTVLDLACGADAIYVAGNCVCTAGYSGPDSSTVPNTASNAKDHGNAPVLDLSHKQSRYFLRVNVFVVSFQLDITDSVVNNHALKSRFVFCLY